MVVCSLIKYGDRYTYKILCTSGDVINDNTSQQIAASESRLTMQSANWSWAEGIVLLVKRKSDLTVG